MAPTYGAAAPVLDGAHFRRVLGRYPTGVCVVTAIGRDGEPTGMTVGSFTSVSLDPPLVGFLAQRRSRAFATVAEAGRFAVNVLAGDQADLCRRFASRDGDKFRAVHWRASPLGSPVLAGAPVWIDCRLQTMFDVGDHVMVVGAVAELDVERSAPPLVFLQGGYGRFSAHSGISTEADDLGTHLRLAELARPRLADLSARFGVHAAAGALVGGQVVQLAWVGAAGTDPRADLVGLRLPFVAPFGLLFAAWESAEVRAAWLGRHPADDPARRALLADVARARRRGWAAVPDHAALRRVEESIVRIATDGRRPASVRELEDRIAGFARQYAELPRDRPRGLSAPVFGPAGRVALTLTVHQLPELDRDRLDECRRALVTAAAELTATATP